jgi:hypothetical protein
MHVQYIQLLVSLLQLLVAMSYACSVHPVISEPVTVTCRYELCMFNKSSY